MYYMTKLKEHSREIINSKWRNHIQVLRQPGTFGGTKVLVPGTITKVPPHFFLDTLHPFMPVKS